MGVPGANAPARNTLLSTVQHRRSLRWGLSNAIVLVCATELVMWPGEVAVWSSIWSCELNEAFN